jgi:ABC-type bacteriocin/lantibiotic exporter with double-glycine peptidase domain
MLAAWMSVLRSGLSRRRVVERIRGEGAQPAAWASWRRLYPYFHRHRIHAVWGALFIGLSAPSGLAPPMITRYLVDDVILGRRVEAVLPVIIVLALCLAAEKILRLAEEFCFARFEQRALLDLQEDLISRILRFPQAFFDEQQTGYLTRRLTEDVESLRFLFSGTLVNAAGQFLRLVGGACFLFYLEWRIALLMLGLLPALAWVMRHLSEKLYLLSRECMEHQAEAAGRIQESLAGAATIKASAAEPGVRGTLMSAFEKVFRSTLEQSVVGSLTGAFVQSIPGAGRAFALAAGAMLVIRGEWTLGSLLAFQAYLSHVFGPAQYLASVNLQLQRVRAAMERVGALFEITPEDPQAGGIRVSKLRGEIEVRQVTFAYGGRRPVLRGLSLHVFPGESVAIMGPTGIGKSTLLSLLLRFYKPSAGDIYFDRRPASSYELDALRRRMGYVPQRPRLVSGSILENLRPGHQDASMEQIIAAARRAGIHEEVLSFPNGYDTAVGEGGLKLSEGQKQRLALARALVGDPDILILDEPTEALDEKTEESVLDALQQWRRGRSVIVVTHRPSTARRCDRVIHLAGSRTLEGGGCDHLAFEADPNTLPMPAINNEQNPTSTWLSSSPSKSTQSMPLNARPRSI